MKVAYNKQRKLYEPVLTEEHVVKEIIQRLVFNKVKIWRIVERIPWGRKTSTPGIPDLIGWANPYQEHLSPLPLYIEVKKPGGKRRLAQEQFIKEAKAAGAIAFFAECWDDVVAEFKEQGIALK